MDGQIGGLDVQVWPDSGHELLFADQLAWMLDHRDEDIESAATDTNGPVCFKQQPLFRKQPEWAKRDLVGIIDGRFRRSRFGRCCACTGKERRTGDEPNGRFFHCWVGTPWLGHDKDRRCASLERTRNG